MNEKVPSSNEKLNDPSPGNRLRHLREAKGLSLEQIAEQTHVRLQYLKAIEKEDLEALFCPAYAKSYLKAYCRAIDADEDILDSYRELIETSEFEKSSSSEPNIPSKSYRIPVFIGLIIIVIIAIAVFLLKPRAIDDRPVVQSAESPPDSLTSVPDISAGKILETVVFEDSLLTLRIIASETTWVRVMVDGSDKPGFIMSPGSIRIFDAREDFRITLGNAGGVELNLNGRPVPPLGEAGQVVRDIPLGWKTIESPSP